MRLLEPANELDFLGGANRIFLLSCKVPNNHISILSEMHALNSSPKVQKLIKLSFIDQPVQPSHPSAACEGLLDHQIFPRSQWVEERCDVEWSLSIEPTIRPKPRSLTIPNRELYKLQRGPYQIGHKTLLRLSMANPPHPIGTIPISGETLD